MAGCIQKIHSSHNTVKIIQAYMANISDHMRHRYACYQYTEHNINQEGGD